MASRGPPLIFVTQDGAVVCENGRGKVEESPEDFPWPAKARENLDAALDSINEVATALLFTDKCADAVVEVAAVEAFDAVAASFFKEGKADERIRFGLASATDGEQALRLRGFLGAAMAATPSTAVIVVVDVPKRTKAIMPVPAAYSAADITSFINDYLAGRLHRGSRVGTPYLDFQRRNTGVTGAGLGAIRTWLIYSIAHYGCLHCVSPAFSCTAKPIN